MKMALRLTRLICLLTLLYLATGWSQNRCADAQSIRRTLLSASPTDLPVLRLKALPGRALAMKVPPFGRPMKLRFAPVRILTVPFSPPPIEKERPHFSRYVHNRRKALLKEPPKKAHTGIMVEIESAYGIHNTFIGRLQHGAQLKGAHYSLQGHWEKTDGEEGRRQEENIAGHATVDADFSKDIAASLESAYSQSEVVLPQLEGQQRHKKSVIEVIAGLHVNFETDTNIDVTFSGEDATFTDHNPLDFSVNRYGNFLSIKHLWTPKNTLSFHAENYWELFFQDEERLDTRYYGTNVFLNSFGIHDIFAVDAGAQLDYYYSKNRQESNILFAPVLTTRLSLFGNTTVYATYQPRLIFPDFSELYIHKLYTLVNPDLHAETLRQTVEVGIQQRLGELVSFNVGVFYKEREDVILQIDANSDNLLEYVQGGAGRFMGVKTNLQMNYREQFVQNLTYTYTNYDEFSWESSAHPEAKISTTVLPYIPNHQVQASLYWALPFGFAIDVNGTYVSEQFRNREADQYQIGKRFFLHVELMQRFSENFQIFLLGRNLTDTNTYDIIPILDSEEITSSRLFVGGLRFRF